MPSNGWHDRFRKCEGLSHGALSKESQSVTEEGLGALNTGVLPTLLNEHYLDETQRG
jgi:hypothetical protein